MVQTFETTNRRGGKEISQSYYRNKIDDAKLHQQIWDAYRSFTTRERLQESLHPFDTQQNEAMSASISKYAPKTKTHGMTISLTNRVLISVGIRNLTAVTYWEQVYSSLGLSMADETASFLKTQDIFRIYRKKYAARTDIKSKRAKENNIKIKILMEQQRKDIKRGVTYKSGCAIDSNDAPD